MRTKRILTSLFFTLMLFAGTKFFAQTAVKKTTPTKTTTKPVTKKTVTRKKPATKAGKVYICDGSGGYHFHSRKTCAVLAKCKGRVLDMTKREAMSDWSRKQCKSCY